MIKNLIIFSINLIILNSSICQNYDPIEFKTINDNWSHYILPQGFLYENIGCPIIENPIFFDNGFYVTHSIWNVGVNQGFISERIDLINGNLKWSNTYYFDSINTREYPSDPKVVNDSYSLLLNKESRTVDIFGDGALFLWFTSVYGERDFNILDGTVQRDYLTDSTLAENDMVLLPISLDGSTVINERDGSNILRISDSGFRLTTQITDNSGPQIDTINLSRQIPYEFVKQTSTFEEIGKDKYVGIAYFKNRDTLAQNDKLVILSKFNSYLSSYEEIDITNLAEGFENIRVLDFQSNGVVLVMFESLFDFKQPLTFKSINLMGIVEETITLEGSLSDFNAVKIPTEDGMLIYENHIETDTNYFIFHKSDGFGNIELTKEESINLPNDFCDISNIYFTPKNDVILQMGQYKKTDLGKLDRPVYSSYHHIDGETFDLSTKNKNIGIKPFKLYPNPTTGEVNIEAEIQIYSVDLVDISGRVFTLPIRTNNTMDVSCFPTGLYKLILKNDDNSIYGITSILITH